ncbi:MAG: hypothetical protein PHU51_05365 [Candidatus Nanoarchaeia archaeon]|nr:hypothetical protein [Candidatus Nanoarchaeia archaeon]
MVKGEFILKASFVLVLLLLSVNLVHSDTSICGDGNTYGGVCLVNPLPEGASWTWTPCDEIERIFVKYVDLMPDPWLTYGVGLCNQYGCKNAGITGVFNPFAVTCDNPMYSWTRDDASSPCINYNEANCYTSLSADPRFCNYVYEECDNAENNVPYENRNDYFIEEKCIDDCTVAKNYCGNDEIDYTYYDGTNCEYGEEICIWREIQCIVTEEAEEQVTKGGSDDGGSCGYLFCYTCGNSVALEECDEGSDNLARGSGSWTGNIPKCLADCTKSSYCGDGVCDWGYETSNKQSTNYCADCFCGDKIKQEGCLSLKNYCSEINTDYICDMYGTEPLIDGDGNEHYCEWKYIDDNYLEVDITENPGACFDLEGFTCFSKEKDACIAMSDYCIWGGEECDKVGDYANVFGWCDGSSEECNYCCEDTCTIKTMTPPSTCSDTDATGTYPSGENYYVFGTLTSNDATTFNDTCYKNELTEQYCSGEIPNSTKVNCVDMGGTCLNGKCTCDCPRTGFDSTYKYCNYQRTGYTGTKTTIMSNDYPLNINDPTANTCCDSASKCVLKGIGTCLTEGTPWDYGSIGKFTHICDDGMWVDFDSTQANCNLFGNGAEWAPGGVSFASTTASSGDVSAKSIELIRVGEYNKVGEMECCGDDDNEELVSTYCPNSETNNIPTCCPDNTYKLINGQCVKECPSIERTAKVVIDVPSDEDLLTTINLLLKSENESLGCYPSTDTCSNFVVNLAPINVPSPTPYAYCEDGQGVFQSGTSDDIVVTDTTTTLKSNPITNCEKTQFCVEEDLYSENLNALPGDLENFLVFTKGTTTKGLVKYNPLKFTIDQKTIATYKTGTNCVATNCEMKSIPVVQTATCYPTCEVNSTNCFITCINEEPWTKFVFDGPGCTLTGDSCVVQDLVIEDYTVTKGLAAPKAGDDPSVDNGRTPTEIYKMYSTSFSTETFCIPSNEDCIEEAICVSPKTTNVKGESVDQKMKIYDFYGNEYVQAVVSPHASVTGGEYWCSDGYEIDTIVPGEFVCKKIEDVCAWGTTDHLTPNCDWNNMLNGEDVWGLYNDECFYDIDTSTPDQYERSCCYSTSYGDIQVYETTSVKVY